MASIDDQYRIITRGGGWIDRTASGRLRFEGADAASFLQSLLSNEIRALSPGQGAYAAYLTPAGRMISDIEVLNRGGFLLGLVTGSMAPRLAARLDQLIFAEAVTVTDDSASWTELVVTGSDAARIAASALGMDAVQLTALAELSQVDWESGFIMGGGARPFPTLRIFAPAASRERIISSLEEAGASALSEELATALRIETGRPLWGVDMTEETIPLEAGLLERAISTSKGCYVGQEIVIRILHRAGGRVARRLAILTIEGYGSDEAPPVGTKMLADGQPVGHLTSVAYSPVRGGVIALGYVHRDAAETGRQLQLAERDNATATIAGFAS